MVLSSARGGVWLAGSMRITGGRARGIPLTTGRARQVRPATDRMREAVFSSLGERVTGARFLDLFAGSGAYGLEALSRGAAGGLFVEQDPAAVAALKANLGAVLKSLGQPPGITASILRRDALKCETPDRFSLVFMDPPYDLARRETGRLLRLARGFLDPLGDAVLVFELPGDLELPLAGVPAPDAGAESAGWECLRRIGKSGTNEPSVALLQAVQ